MYCGFKRKLYKQICMITCIPGQIGFVGDVLLLLLAVLPLSLPAAHAVHLFVVKVTLDALLSSAL